MHTYRPFTHPGGVTVYRVGYYDPSAARERWMFVKEFNDEDEAAAYVSYLNGGAAPKTGGPLVVEEQYKDV